MVGETSFGAVVSGNREASAAAQRMLLSGGNAADAATVCLLMLCLTEPGATSLGGEAPLMIFDAKTQKVDVLCGLGAAPGSAKAARRYELPMPGDERGTNWRQRAVDLYKLGTNWYRRGIYDAATPATVHLCVSLLIHYGTASFERVVEPVLEWLIKNKPTQYRDSVHKVVINAVTGKPVKQASPDSNGSTQLWWQDLLNTFKRLVDAEKRQPGDRQSKLHAVIGEFYEGEIAEEIARWYEKSHALLTYEDLARHTTRIESPVSVEYGGLEVLKCGLWTQGPLVSQALKILSGFDTRDQNCNVDERSHVVAETLKLAMADRFRHFGDPDFNSIAVDDLLADDYISLRRELINLDEAQTYGPGDPLSCRARALPADDGTPSSTGTTTCTVADKFGNVVTITPSGVGSLAGAAGTTGIVHGTRLSQFVQQSGHANSIACLKRPCITPSPTIVLKDGKPLLAASLSWGNYQDQLALTLIVELVSHGLCFDDTIASQQLMQPCLLMTPFCKYGQGEIMVPTMRPRSAEHLQRMGHNVIRKQWYYGWSVIYFDPLSGQPRTWTGNQRS